MEVSQWLSDLLVAAFVAAFVAGLDHGARSLVVAFVALVAVAFVA